MPFTFTHMNFNLTLTIGDFLSAFILGGLIHIVLYLRRMELIIYQHGIMWEEFKRTHGLSDYSGPDPRGSRRVIVTKAH